MKKEKIILPAPGDKKIDTGSNPENKFKKDKSAASVDNIITSAVGKTIARTGSGLANKGTSVSYEQERD